MFRIETYAEATMPVHEFEGMSKDCRGHVFKAPSVPPMAMRSNAKETMMHKWCAPRTVTHNERFKARPTWRQLLIASF